MDPALRAVAQGEAPGETEAIIRLVPGSPPQPQVRLIARFGEIATCRLQQERIWEVWSEDEVASLKAPRPFGLDPDPLEETSADAEELEAGASDVRRPPDLTVTGDGILVGIVDWGFDFAHPNLRDPSGLTRIRALWDQSAPGAGLEPYGYGRVFRREEIDAALASDDPYTALGYHPASGDPQGRGAHGTHVVDIAAGSGLAAGSPLGMAPGAELLCVHLANRGTGGLATLGDSVTLLEALHWIFREAGDTPCVVNLSVGRHGGPHNGLTLVEQAIDAALVEAPGRCVVQSTGNYYTADSHAERRLAPGQEWTFHWITDRADVTPNELEVWYPGRDVLTLEIRPPGVERAVRVGIGQEQPIEIEGQEVGRAYHRARDPGAGDNHIDVFLAPAAPAGEWQITLRARDVVDGRVHVWVERDAGCPSCQSRISPQDAVASCTTGTICNGFRTISVGAYRAQSPRRELAPFSSAGPTRDGRSKPDLVAPGVRVLAARSAPRDGGPVSLLVRQSGTSMAAPHVTGTVALMFQAAGRPLAIHETRSLLFSAAESPEPDQLDAGRHGSGFLDVARAVELAAANLDPMAIVDASQETAEVAGPVGGELEDSLSTESDEPETELFPPDEETFELPEWAYEPECLPSAQEPEAFELPAWAYEPELLHVGADDEAFQLPEWAYEPEFLRLTPDTQPAASVSCACCQARSVGSSDLVQERSLGVGEPYFRPAWQEVEDTPRPGQPVPTTTHTVKIVVKSFINRIGARIGLLPPRCLIMPPAAGDLAQLAALAAFTDLSFRGGEDPRTGAKDGIYRLFTECTFTISCASGGLVGVTHTALDHDVGLECVPFTSQCLTPPPMTVEHAVSIQRSARGFNFRWKAKGRPHPLADAAFQAVCPRTSVFIWHEIQAQVDCTGARPAVTGLVLRGSRFPSHRAFVDGVLVADKPQAAFSRLWMADPADMTRVM